MANPIRKLIQLVLDRASAKKTEEDAKKSLGLIDQSIDKLKGTALKVGAAIGALFAVHKLKEFLGESIKLAGEHEAVWSQLGNTVNNVGGNFDDLEPKVRALSQAFEDATIHDDDEFAQGLQSLIVISGDVDASINNMGLVANVAAAFFKGQLAPAIDVVGRAMTGQTRVLRPLIGAQKDAQKGLEILAQRSMGAASKEAQTLQGRVEQLSVSWGNFKKAIGLAIAGGNSMTGSVQQTTGSIKDATRWVDMNADEVNAWAKGSLSFAVTVLDGVYRGVKGLADILAGALTGALAIAEVPILALNEAFAATIEVVGHLVRVVNHDLGQSMIDFAKFQREGARTGVGSLFKTSGSLFAQGASAFASPSFFAPAPLTTPPSQLPNNKPQLGKNRPLTPEEEQAHQKALEEAKKVTESVATATEKYATTVAKLREQLKAGLITQETFNRAHGEAADEMNKGLADTSKAISDAQDQYQEFSDKMLAADEEMAAATEQATASYQDYQDAINEPNTEAISALAEAKKALDDQAKSSAILARETQTLGDKFDELRSTHDILVAALMATDPTSPGWDALMAQLRGVQDEMQNITRLSEFVNIAGDATSNVWDHLAQRGRTLTNATTKYNDAIEELNDKLSRGIITQDQYNQAIYDEQKAFEKAKKAAGSIGESFGAGIKELASAKAKENAILAIEELAHGFAAVASIFGATAAPLHFAAAAKYTAVSAAWGGFSAALPGGGGGGGGVAAPSMARDVGGRQSESLRATGPEINLWVDPFDKDNPVHQDQAGEAAKLYAERVGGQLVFRMKR